MTAEKTDKAIIDGQASSSEDKDPEHTNLTPDSPSVQEQEIGDDFFAESQRLEALLRQYENRLESLLIWKENLKLLTLDANLNTAYYRSWRHEANRLFVRCSIIRKRLGGVRAGIQSEPCDQDSQAESADKKTDKAS